MYCFNERIIGGTTMFSKGSYKKTINNLPAHWRVRLEAMFYFLGQ
jgi:hypothetical protein